jgi:hypothetical protein
MSHTTSRETSRTTCLGTRTRDVGEVVDDEATQGKVVDDEPRDEPWRRAARCAEAPGRAS